MRVNSRSITSFGIIFSFVLPMMVIGLGATYLTIFNADDDSSSAFLPFIRQDFSFNNGITSNENIIINNFDQYFLEEKDSQSLQTVSFDLIDNELIIDLEDKVLKLDTSRGSGSLNFISDSINSVNNYHYIISNSNGDQIGITKKYLEQTSKEQSTEIYNVDSGILLGELKIPVDEFNSPQFQLLSKPILDKNAETLVLHYTHNDPRLQEYKIFVWDLNTQQVKIEYNSSSLSTIKFNHSENKVLAHGENSSEVKILGTTENKIDSLDTQSRAQMVVKGPQPNTLISLNFYDPVKDFKILEVETIEPLQLIKIWDLETKMQVGEINIFGNNAITKIMSVENSNLVLAVREDGQIDFFDIINKNIVKNIQVNDSLSVLDKSEVHLSSDGNKIIALSDKQEIKIWDFSVKIIDPCDNPSGFLERIRCAF